MARPRQERKVCCMPACRRFQPETPVSSEEIQLTVEEYETLRLMDLEGYTQAECAQTMGIAGPPFRAFMPPPGGRSAACWWRADPW